MVFVECPRVRSDLISSQSSLEIVIIIGKMGFKSRVDYSKPFSHNVWNRNDFRSHLQYNAIDSQSEFEILIVSAVIARTLLSIDNWSLWNLN